MGVFTRGAAAPDAAARYVDGALPRPMGAALSLTGNRHDAEDLVQDTLAKVIVHWRRVESADSVDAYVRRAMVNTFVSGKRKRASREVVSHDLVTADGLARVQRDSGDALADRDQVWTMLSRLTRHQRAVLVLRFYDDLPDSAIAEALDCSAVSVRVTAHRAMAALRAMSSPLEDSAPCPEQTGVAATTPR
jgi:RNA polymerase sigma-70 factor (sigma-E family)